jgi:hypothetical protein
LREQSRLRKSFLPRVQYIQGMTSFVMARAALATYDEDPKARAQELQQLLGKLASVGRRWTTALAGMLGAGLSLRTGDAERASRGLESAERLLADADMLAHAAACRLALGKLRGGSEGSGLRAEAEARLRQLGVREPERFARALLPEAR